MNLTNLYNDLISMEKVAEEKDSSVKEEAQEIVKQAEAQVDDLLKTAEYHYKAGRDMAREEIIKQAAAQGATEEELYKLAEAMVADDEDEEDEKEETPAEEKKEEAKETPEEEKKEKIEQIKQAMLNDPEYFKAVMAKYE